jgi:hypothetical protein
MTQQTLASPGAAYAVGQVRLLKTLQLPWPALPVA